MRNRLRFFLPLAFAICSSFAVSSRAQNTEAVTNLPNTFTATNTFNAGVVVQWQSTTTYVQNAIVAYMGSLYQSIGGNNLNNVPTNQSFWLPVSNTATLGPSAGIVYVATAATGGNDANPGTPTSPKLTWLGGCIALPGGSPSPPTCGSGDIYIISQIWAQPNHAFGLMLMGNTDPNYAVPPTGWMRTSGPLTTTCLGAGENTFSNGATTCQIQGGSDADNVHPGMWMSGSENSTTWNGLKIEFQGINVILSVCSDGTQSVDCGVQNVTFDGVDTTPGNAPPSAGPGWLIGTNTLYVIVRNYSISGNPNATDYTADNAAAILLKPTGGNFGSGGVFFYNGVLPQGGMKIHGGNGGSAVGVENLNADTDNGHTEATVWLADGVATLSLKYITPPSDCFSPAPCYSIENSTQNQLVSVDSEPPIGGLVTLYAQTIPSNPITTSIATLFGTITPSYWRMQADSASRQFGPIIVPGTSLVSTTLNSGNVLCSTCTVHTGVADPAFGTRAVNITDTGSENLVINATSDGGAVTGDTEAFSMWIAAPNGTGYGNFPLQLSQANSGTVCSESGSSIVTLKDVSGGLGYEHYIGKCTLTTYTNPGAPSLQISVSSTQPVNLAFPQLILIHGKTPDEVADVYVNIGSWNSSLSTGVLGDLIGAIPHLNSANAFTSQQTFPSFAFPEGAAPSAISGQDICYGDSSAHALKCSNNGGGFQALNFGTQPVSTGGTGLTSLTTNCVIVGAGTSSVHFACPVMNGYVLTDNGPGSDPTFQTPGGSAATAISGLTAATAANTPSNGDNNQRWNWHLTTNNGIGMYFGESSASTATGSYLLRTSTLSTSTAKPFRMDANGNGLEMDTNGRLNALGTGSVNFAALSNFPTSCSNNVVIGLTSATAWNCQKISSSYVDTSIAQTGADINTSNQVTVTHLASALTINQGGTAQTTGPIKRLYIQFAGNNAGSAAPGWDLPGSNGMSPAPKTDSSNGTVQGILQAAQGNIAYATMVIPADFSSFSTAKINFATSDTTTGHTIIFNVATACTDPNGSAADTPAYNSANAFTTVTLPMSAVANSVYSTTTTGTLTGTSCAAGYILHLKMTRSGADTSTDTAIALTGGMIVAYVGAYN